MASLLPSGEKSGPLVFGTSRVALLPSGFAMKADWIPLDGSIRSNAIWPFGPGTFALAGAAKAVRHSAADAVMARMARSTPARRTAQRFTPAAGTWAAPLALATPAARTSNAPAAAATTAARLIRLRIATPHLLQSQHHRPAHPGPACPRRTVIPMTEVKLDAADAAELAEMLQFPPRPQHLGETGPGPQGLR